MSIELSGYPFSVKGLTCYVTDVLRFEHFYIWKNPVMRLTGAKSSLKKTPG